MQRSLAKASAEKQLKPAIASVLLMARFLSSSPCDRKSQEEFRAWVFLRSWFSTMERGLFTLVPDLHPKVDPQNLEETLG